MHQRVDNAQIFHWCKIECKFPAKLSAILASTSVKTSVTDMSSETKTNFSGY